jgi:hypothetical protein
MPKTIAQRLTALEKTIAAFFGREKVQAKKAVKRTKSKVQRVIKKTRKAKAPRPKAAVA